MTGITSGVPCGTISDTNCASPIGDGPAFDFLRAKMCSRDGDSGPPQFASLIALGLHSGNNGVRCTNDNPGNHRTFATKAYNGKRSLGVTIKLR